MLRALAYVLMLAVAVAAAVWVADRPGAVTVDWLDWRLETSVPVLLAVLLAIAAGLTLLLRLMAGLAQLPSRWAGERRQRLRRKGYLALTDGLVAAASGQAGRAKKLAGRAQKLLEDPALTGFLSAQAARLSGDHEAARDHYQRMLERPETTVLGLRGLLEQALARHDDSAAIDLATRARAFSPDDGWLVETLFVLLLKRGRLREAHDLIADAGRNKALPATVLARHRALVLNERAARAEASGDRRDAVTLAGQAATSDPGLTAAALRLARLQATAGRPRRAAAVLEAAWARQPVPALARAYADLVPGETPLQRVRRLEKLAARRPADAESALALGEASLEAKLWGQARKHLLAAAQARPAVRPFTLLARLEQAEYHNETAARAWLDKAMAAAADPAWVCRSCGHVAAEWATLCPACDAVDSLTWSTPRPLPAPAAERSAEPPAPVANLASR